MLAASDITWQGTLVCLLAPIPNQIQGKRSPTNSTLPADIRSGTPSDSQEDIDNTCACARGADLVLLRPGTLFLSSYSDLIGSQRNGICRQQAMNSIQVFSAQYAARTRGLGTALACVCVWGGGGGGGGGY